MSVLRVRLTGLGEDGLAAESVSIDQRGNATTNRVWRYRDDAMEISETKYPTSIIPAMSIVSNNLAIMSVSQTGVTNIFSYDALNRQIAATDGRGNTTQTIYDANGRVVSTIDALGYTTRYGYDALGRSISVTDSLTNTVYTAYDAEDRVVSQRGATYPVDYSYSEFGEKVSMTTYRDMDAIGDTTRWLRDEATGLVTNKVYADGKGPTYTYTPEGKLATRTWARGIVTTYSYDDNGSLTNTVYSDGTPTISLAYNRAGRQIEAHDAAGVTTFLYDDFGAVTNETVVGVAGTNTIERCYDSFGRSLGYSLNGTRQSTIGYDSVGRISSMLANGSDTPFTWNYLPNSDLKSSLSYPNGLTASWIYDANNQVLQVCNAFPTNIISQYDYIYDAAGRRTERYHSGSAFDHPDQIYYDYNNRSELTNAIASVDASYNFSYSYDNIGNRLWSLEDTNHVEYAANSLNQYTSISNLCDSASLRDEFIPQYDADGNQTLIKTSTGIWSATYNGENRPIYWSNGVTNIVMSFDRMGRRVQYLETIASTTNANNTFTYDNYLCIARHRALPDTTTETDHFIWDPTEPIATRPLVFNYSTATPAYYTHDGNKNVSELVDIEEGVCAHYEYDIFGALKYSIGISKLLNPWGFSSEYEDYLCGLTYYNYRHYNHYFGNWTTRDRVEMENPYIYCDNIIFSFDVLGLEGFLSGLVAKIKKCWRRYKCYLLKSYLDEGSRFSGVDRKIFDMWMHGGGENPLNADAFDPGQELRNQIINNIVASHLNDNKDANCGGNPSKNYHATQTAISPTFHLGRLPDIMSYTIRGYKKFAYDCELRTEKECSKDCSCERINVSGECKFTFEDDFEFQDSGSFFFGLVDEKTVKDCACEFNWVSGRCIVLQVTKS